MATATPWARTRWALDERYAPHALSYDPTTHWLWTLRTLTHGENPEEVEVDGAALEAWDTLAATRVRQFTLPLSFPLAQVGTAHALSVCEHRVYISQSQELGEPEVICRVDPDSGAILATVTLSGTSGLTRLYAHPSGLYAVYDDPSGSTNRLAIGRWSPDLSTAHYTLVLATWDEADALMALPLAIDAAGEAYTAMAHTLYQVSPTGSVTTHSVSGLATAHAPSSMAYIACTTGPQTTIAADATNDRYTRSDGGNFSTDGLVAGQAVLVEGFSDPANNGLHVIVNVSADNFRVEEALVDEAEGASVTITGDSLLLAYFDMDGTANRLLRWSTVSQISLGVYDSPEYAVGYQDELFPQGDGGRVWLWHGSTLAWVEFDVWHLTALRTLPLADTWGLNPSDSYYGVAVDPCSPALWTGHRIADWFPGNNPDSAGLYKLTRPDDAPAEGCPIVEGTVTQVPIERVSGAPVSGVTQLVVECVSLSGAPARVSQLAVELVRDNVAEPPPPDPAARPRRAFVTT